ncbi:MAG: hypothetical protein E7185_09940 [Erysipelotrichaceae bacterium]|nr:hypothetical protein [Erysipelotrichaceae bacterium]
MFFTVMVAALLIVMAIVIWACVEEIRQLIRNVRECEAEVIETRQLIFAQKDFINRKLLELEAQREEIKEMQARLVDVQNKYVAAKRRLEIYAREKAESIYGEKS